jgi:uncharacterized membrane protein YadS
VSVSGIARLLPGLLLVTALAAAAFALARLPGAQLLGPLVLALVLGVVLRAALRRPLPASVPGIAFSARTLLRLGIVLLGVRLDARALVELGPWVLVGSAVGAVVAFGAIELAGRAWRVPTDLRRLVGIGTAICGASAIAAALPLVRRVPGEPSTPGGPAPVAIAAISLLGTVGVLGFLALGLATSLGVVPPAWVAAIALAGTALTAAAMAAIGMGVDVSAIGRSGRQALALGAVGFAALMLAMVGWYAVLLR